MKISKLVPRGKGLSVAASKTTFSTMRASFTPRFSFDEKIERDLTEWGQISNQGLCLVHALGEHALNGELFKKRAQDVLRGWDVISTSLVTRSRAWRQAQVHVTGNVIPRQTEYCNYMYANVGLILKVPPQNILGTHEYDVFFPTHAPAKHYEFASRVLARRTANGKYFNEDRFTKIVSPLELLKKTMEGPSVGYNEILVVTRPNVRVHFSATQEVSVQGIVYSECSSLDDKNEERDRFMLELLCKLNPDLSIEYI